MVTIVIVIIKTANKTIVSGWNNISETKSRNAWLNDQMRSNLLVIEQNSEIITH